MFDLLQVHDRPVPTTLVHNACVQGDLTVAIGQTAVPDGTVAGVGFLYAAPRFYGIQWRATLLQTFEGSASCVGNVPGSDDERVTGSC